MSQEHKKDEEDLSNAQLPPDRGEGLSDKFMEIVGRQDVTNRAWMMVDAMLEENPGLEISEAFQRAMEWLKQHPEDLQRED